MFDAAVSLALDARKAPCPNCGSAPDQQRVHSERREPGRASLSREPPRFLAVRRYDCLICREVIVAAVEVDGNGKLINE